ncbi:hypothetical protein D3C84_911220 [compost metagenome]
MGDAGLLHRATDFFRYQKRAHIVGAGQHHRKLFTAITRCQVTGTLDVVIDDRADAAQTFIAGHMTVKVVEALEVIDIDHQQCEVGLAPPGPAHFGKDEQIELTPVGQPGQCILQRQQLKAAIDLDQLFPGIEQDALHVILLLHEAYQAIAEYQQKPEE